MSLLLRAFVFQPFYVPSSSMAETLQVRDLIVAQRLADFKRGDIVVFADDNGWLGPSENRHRNLVRVVLMYVGLQPSADHLVKRVIGLPGDHVTCCDTEGRLLVNGQPLDESAYLAEPDAPASAGPFDVIVPRNRLFVMGDNRNNSADSRCHLQDISLEGGPAGEGAFVPVSAVVGSVPLIMGPVPRISWMETPETFASVPMAGRTPPEVAVVDQAEAC